VASEAVSDPHVLVPRMSPWSAGLLYTVLVILFGAVVRITGSGAGCGQHWPTCQGEIAHLPQSVETLIEFSHRLTSGLSMVLVGGLTWLSFRRFGAAHPVRRAAVAACVLIAVEALIGAALVLLRYVGNNDSMGRAVIMALHLLNTLALTGAMGWAALGWQRPATRLVARSPVAGPLALGAFGIVLVAASGAVTALGDTLYPVVSGTSAGDVVVQTASQGAHFLERLRGVHPLLAVGVGFGLLWLGPWVATRAPAARPWARAVSVAVWSQLGLGLLNVWWSAPGWLQVVHLAAALGLWLSWVGLAFVSLGSVSQGRGAANERAPQPLRAAG
jgi:heme A synthase